MTIDQLGTIRGQFRPSITNLFAGVILGVLAIVGGCALLYLCINGAIQSGGNLPFWTAKGQKGWSWGAVGIMTVIGMALVAGGAFLVWWMHSLLSHRVQIAEHGVAVMNKNSTSVFKWEDISQISEMHIYEKVPIIKGAPRAALPEFMSRSILVETIQGESFAFDRNTIKNLEQLYELIKSEAVARCLSWQIVEQYS